MNNRTSLFLWLMLLSTSACTSSAPVESHVDERLEWFTAQTKAKVRAKAERHRIRERLRAQGERVCEEGEWPQHWREGCDPCGCDYGDIGGCLYYRPCPDAERAPLPPNPDVESVGSQMGKRLDTLTRRTRAELRHKALRHEIRERYRAAGARVCEEGEWPQEWWDGCKWCWCDIKSQVRQCDWGPECDPEVERKLWEQRLKDARETTTYRAPRLQMKQSR
jgi:hypothetical protein